MSVAKAGVVAMALALLMMVGAPPASAGGSVWETIPATVTVGDSVTVWAAVAWAHNDSLGTPDDGPYHAYLRKSDGSDDDWAYSFIPDDAMWVAEVEVVLGPYDTGARTVGPNHAIFEFVVPDLAPGEYSILHCNDPCTTPLGDITWRRLLVTGDDGGVPSTPPPAPTTSTASATSTTSTTSSTSSTTATTNVSASSTDGDQAALVTYDGSADDRSAEVAGGAVGVSLLAGAGLVGWTIRRRRSPT